MIFCKNLNDFERHDYVYLESDRLEEMNSLSNNKYQILTCS